MPTYEYECSKCGHAFEALQSMKDDPLTDCPAKGCKGKKTLRRLIGAGSGIIFKGSGFYKTDYKGGSASAGKGDSGSAKGESPAAESKPKSGGGCGCGGGTCGH